MEPVQIEKISIFVFSFSHPSHFGYRGAFRGPPSLEDLRRQGLQIENRIVISLLGRRRRESVTGRGGTQVKIQTFSTQPEMRTNIVPLGEEPVAFPYVGGELGREHIRIE